MFLVFNHADTPTSLTVGCLSLYVASLLEEMFCSKQQVKSQLKQITCINSTYFNFHIGISLVSFVQMLLGYFQQVVLQLTTATRIAVKHNSYPPPNKHLHQYLQLLISSLFVPFMSALLVARGYSFCSLKGNTINCCFTYLNCGRNMHSIPTLKDITSPDSLPLGT